MKKIIVVLAVAAVALASATAYAQMHHKRSPLVLGRNYVRIVDVEKNRINYRRRTMDDTGVGWIAAIIIGGIAGWLAEQFMKSNMGMLMNIVLGIVGAAIASALLSVVGIQFGEAGLAI